MRGEVWFGLGCLPMILSRDPWQETINHPEETDPVLEKNDG